jgi:hypothetical protein
LAAEDEKLEIIPERVFEIRETRVFRLARAAGNNLGRSSRQIDIVAARHRGVGSAHRIHEILKSRCLGERPLDVAYRHIAPVIAVRAMSEAAGRPEAIGTQPK